MPAESIIKQSFRKCQFQDCDKPSRARGFCIKHYTRLRKYGDPTVKLRGSRGESFGFVDPQGYKRISIKGKGVGEHRVVMSRRLGRKLKRTEVVHHKDHDRLNNDISNLDLLTHSEHMRIHRAEAQAKRLLDGTPPGKIKCVLKECPNYVAKWILSSSARPPTEWYCPTHYRTFLHDGTIKRLHSPRPAICSIDGCDLPCWARSLCSKHYEKIIRRPRRRKSTIT